MMPPLLAFQQRGLKSMDDRQAEKEQAAFQEEIKDFLNKDTFNLFDFHERVMVSAQTSAARSSTRNLRV